MRGGGREETSYGITLKRCFKGSTAPRGPGPSAGFIASSPHAGHFHRDADGAGGHPAHRTVSEASPRKVFLARRSVLAAASFEEQLQGPLVELADVAPFEVHDR